MFCFAINFFHYKKRREMLHMGHLLRFSTFFYHIKEQISQAFGKFTLLKIKWLKQFLRVHAKSNFTDPKVHVIFPPQCLRCFGRYNCM